MKETTTHEPKPKGKNRKPTAVKFRLIAGLAVFYAQKQKTCT